MGFNIDINLKRFRGISTEKNIRSFLATEHAKLGIIKNCLNSITC